MPIQIQLKGANETFNFLNRLPRELNKEITKAGELFMKKVQKSAKLRAPRATGFLASQINVKKQGRRIVLSTGNVPYAYFQEFGFTPHVIPIQYLEMHYGSPGARGVRIPGRDISGYAWVSRNKPFIMPALKANLAKLSALLSKRTKNAINKARR